MPTDAFDVVDFVVNKGHGVAGLAEMGLKSVPDQYIQPVEERLESLELVIDESIPIIDVCNWEDQTVCDAICNASKKYGFFQIINHGIPIEVLEEVQVAAHRFFQLPTEEKVKYKADVFKPGTAKLETSFSPNKEKILEWKDYLSMHYVDHETASANWPPVCKDAALDYFNRVQVIVRKIYDILLKGLKLKGFDESKRSLLMGRRLVNFNYYPSCPNPELIVGVGRHSDASALTVLLQDDVGGLYVRDPDGKSWIHVLPTKGALVINMGDMIQLLSNGHYNSIEHKVVANSAKSRVSIATFILPALDQVVAPLPELLEANGEKPLYREFLYNDYFKYFFSKGHDGKATIEWAKI
ncbi:hypothetical protein Ancab_040550 [Ancistrocladus abbreviatus]